MTDEVQARRIRRRAAKRGLILRIAKDGTCCLLDPRDAVATGSLEDIEKHFSPTDHE